MVSSHHTGRDHTSNRRHPQRQPRVQGQGSDGRRYPYGSLPGVANQRRRTAAARRDRPLNFQRISDPDVDGPGTIVDVESAVGAKDQPVDKILPRMKDERAIAHCNDGLVSAGSELPRRARCRDSARPRGGRRGERHVPMHFVADIRGVVVDPTLDCRTVQRDHTTPVTNASMDHRPVADGNGTKRAGAVDRAHLSLASDNERACAGDGWRDPGIRAQVNTRSNIEGQARTKGEVATLHLGRK